MGRIQALWTFFLIVFVSEAVGFGIASLFTAVAAGGVGYLMAELNFSDVWVAVSFVAASLVLMPIPLSLLLRAYNLRTKEIVRAHRERTKEMARTHRERTEKLARDAEERMTDERRVLMEFAKRLKTSKSTQADLVKGQGRLEGQVAQLQTELMKHAEGNMELIESIHELIRDLVKSKANERDVDFAIEDLDRRKADKPDG